jgi:3-dehydroquinate synthase
MLQEECTRSTTVIALGGGVVTDLAGFVAATFMRGVPVVQVPTSLLAMVDASVGGKVGVDTAAGKNLVGAFHQPSAVVIDPVVLQTLPLLHRRGGMAEVIKHGVIADRSYLLEALTLASAMTDESDSHMAWNGSALSQLIARSVAIKAQVVARDEREVGLRHILNYGHTTAHALEAATGFGTAHGDAVSIGMVVEAVLAERIGRASRGTATEVRAALHQCGLPTTLPPDIAPAQLIELMRRDKKSRAGELVFALPAEVGRMAGEDMGYAIPVDESDVLAVLQSGVL